MAETKKKVGRPRKYGKGEHPNSKNAIAKHQFPKGKSGNPKGPKVNQPKPKPTLEDVLNEVGHEKTTLTSQGKRKVVTKYYAYAHNLFRNAIAGKSPAVKELGERLFGKSPDSINLNITEKPKFKGVNPEKYVQTVLHGDEAAEA